MTLLGGFDLSHAGKAIHLPSSAGRLVAFLALRGRPLSRAHVAGNLWLDASQDRALANLRSAVWRARACDDALLEVGSDRLSLADEVLVDVREATAMSRRLIDGAPAYREDDLEPRGMTEELLPDWYDDWVVLERERLRQLFLHGLEALTRRLSDLGRHAEAVEVGTTVVQREPLRESGHRTLIEAHLAEGNRNEALRQYRAYRAIMRDELGVEPSAALRHMLEHNLGRPV